MNLQIINHLTDTSKPFTILGKDITNIILAEVRKLGYQNLVALKRTCHSFNSLIEMPSILCPYEIKMSVKASKATVMAHDLFLNIVVVGWKEEKKGACFGSIFNLQNGNEIAQLRIQRPNNAIEIRELIIDPTRKQVLASFKRTTLAAWQLDGSLVNAFEAAAEIHSVIHNSQTNQIFAQCWERESIETFHLGGILGGTRKPMQIDFKTSRYHTQRSILYKSESQLIYGAESNRSIKICNPITKKIENEISSKDSRNYLYLDQKSQLIFINENNQIVVCDLIENIEIRHIELPQNADLLDLFYDAKADYLLITYKAPHPTKSKWITTWMHISTLSSGDVVNHFMTKGNEDLCHSITCTLILEEYKLLITGAFGCILGIWDLHTGLLLREVSLVGYNIKQLSFNPHTDQLFITFEDEKENYCTTGLAFKPMHRKSS